MGEIGRDPREKKIAMGKNGLTTRANMSIFRKSSYLFSKTFKPPTAAKESSLFLFVCGICATTSVSRCDYAQP